MCSIGGTNTRNGHVWNPMPDMELESLSGGGVRIFGRGVREKGGSDEPPEPPLVTGLHRAYSLSSLSLSVLPRFFFEPWRLTILLRFVTRISPLAAFLRGCLSFDSARRSRLVFYCCLSEKHVYRGQSWLPID